MRGLHADVLTYGTRWPILGVQQDEMQALLRRKTMSKHVDGIQIMKIEESGKFDTFADAAEEMERRGGGWVEWWGSNDNVEKRWVA